MKTNKYFILESIHANKEGFIAEPMELHYVSFYPYTGTIELIALWFQKFEIAKFTQNICSIFFGNEETNIHISIICDRKPEHVEIASEVLENLGKALDKKGLWKI